MFFLLCGVLTAIVGVVLLDRGLIAMGGTVAAAFYCVLLTRHINPKEED